MEQPRRDLQSEEEILKKKLINLASSVLLHYIFPFLEHWMDSHFMAYNCVRWRLRSTYPISKKSFAFVESVLKKNVIEQV